MTLSEAKLQFAQAVADLINESKLPPTLCRVVLSGIDRALAQLEEEQWQKSQTSEEGGSDG